MTTASFVLNLISTITAVISTIAAVKAKNEVIKLQTILNGTKNAQVSGSVSIKSKGDNHGVVSRVNSGEINMRCL